MRWDDHRNEFEHPDSTFLDIYVDGLDRADWERTYSHLTAAYDCSFEWDSEAAPVPSSLAEIDSRRRWQAPRLFIEANGVEMRWLFFVPSEPLLELDIHPGQVTSEEAFKTLLAFLRDLATLLGRPVRLTPESSPDVVILELPPERVS